MATTVFNSTTAKFEVPQRRHSVDVAFFEMIGEILNTKHYPGPTGYCSPQYAEYCDILTNLRICESICEEKFFSGWISNDLIRLILFREWDIHSIFDSTLGLIQIWADTKSYQAKDGSTANWYECKVRIPGLIVIELSEAAGWDNEFIEKFVRTAIEFVVAAGAYMIEPETFGPDSLSSGAYHVRAYHHSEVVNSIVSPSRIWFNFRDNNNEDISLTVSNQH